jgi:lysyl-tRNA synthetase, class II
VTGKATRTPTGELTIEATRLPELLSPSLVPLPFKLKDENALISQRHVDLLVNQSTTDVLRLRSYIIKNMRDFFDQKGFLEFQTPILAENAGGAIARPFATHATEFPSKGLALRIAPELWLKRLVVGGIDRVFEIGPSFRNEGIDQTHNPEFTTCEFYSAYASLEDLISMTEELITDLTMRCQVLISTKLTSLPPVQLTKFMPPFRRMEFIPSLEDALGCKLPDLGADTALEQLTTLVEAKKIDVPKSAKQSLPKLLDRLAAIYIEPHSVDEPLFVLHHPVCMSPLSKSFQCPKTSQIVSARTELFIGGRELANMYEEENDPVEQRRKFVEQARYKDPTASDPDDVVVVDESYVRALESGLPPTGGWGCGIERLVMLFSGARRISDCLSFGNLRNVVGLSAEGSTAASNPGNVES